MEPAKKSDSEDLLQEFKIEESIKGTAASIVMIHGNLVLTAQSVAKILNMQHFPQDSLINICFHKIFNEKFIFHV